MSAKKQVEPERPDDDNPPVTAEELQRARPASEVLAALIGERPAAEILRRGRGRPASARPKVNQTLRIDADVLEAYRRAGPGWQTRINELLRAHMPK